MNLATASINPAFVVVPAYLPTREALAFWLTNPLLVAVHPALIEERTEQYPGWNAAQQLGLLTRLKARRDTLRNLVAVGRADVLPMAELLRLLNAHEAVLSEQERSYALAFAFKLHSAERQWYHDFLKAAFTQREEVAYQQAA